jgi:hypothetical protein
MRMRIPPTGHFDHLCARNEREDAAGHALHDQWADLPAGRQLGRAWPAAPRTAPACRQSSDSDRPRSLVGAYSTADNKTRGWRPISQAPLSTTGIGGACTVADADRNPRKREKVYRWVIKKGRMHRDPLLGCRGAVADHVTSHESLDSDGP